MNILPKADLLKSLEDIVKHAEAFELVVHDQQALQTPPVIMHVQHKSMITKDKRTNNLKNHVTAVLVNPTNLLNVLVHALHGANPVSIVIPKITLPIFGDNQKNQNQLMPSFHRSHIETREQLQYQQSTTKTKIPAQLMFLLTHHSNYLNPS